ncbi:MAG TPA: hypothetical protein VNH46_02535 [Gemmatimonadales bacterium]|nr:hypothetical protein [Gemmatimonadales bacterium]
MFDVLPAGDRGAVRVPVKAAGAGTVDTGALSEAAPEDPEAGREWAYAWARARLGAKSRRDYKEADRIRDLLRAAGWEVRDSRDGTVEVRRVE